MIKIKADFYKLVYWAEHLNDNLATLQLLEEFQKQGRECIIHAMGEQGRPSRLLGAIRGNCWSYVSLQQTDQTAAGQISLEQAHDIYELNKKSQHTHIIGLLGYPITQSRGWLYHNRLINWAKKQPEINREKLQDFLYLNFPVKDFESFWSCWSDYVDGLSITIPHKKNVVKKLDVASSSVEKSGVCNTVLRRKKYWWGFNTDMLAIYDLLLDSETEHLNTALVYGTGATAQSAIAALRELNIDNLYLSGRNEHYGNQLAKTFLVEFIPEQKLKNIQPLIIIQTTPVGMVPEIDRVPPLSPLLPGAKLVLDVIHNPPISRFLKEAEASHCRIISGEQMYLRQAAYQFKLFSGIELPASVFEEVWNEHVKQPNI
jgi:3-dehydroquinate dehydratase/shikimate dehydrogenase